jgi:hypothetical protein
MILSFESTIQLPVMHNTHVNCLSVFGDSLALIHGQVLGYWTWGSDRK